MGRAGPERLVGGHGIFRAQGARGHRCGGVRRGGDLLRHHVLHGRRPRRRGRPAHALHPVDGHARRGADQAGARHRRRRPPRQQRRRRTGERRVDGPEGALAQATPTRALRPGRQSVRVPGLRQPQAHRAVLRIRQQRRRAMALRRRTTPGVAAGQAGHAGARGEVAEGRGTDGTHRGAAVGCRGGAPRSHAGHPRGARRRRRFRRDGGPRNRPPRSARAHHRVLAPAPGRDRGSVPRAGDLGDLLRGARR